MDLNDPNHLDPLETMARLIRADGTEEDVYPVNGKKFTLEEMQKYVGGYIEIMPGVPFKLIMDEEARLKDKPYNEKATGLVLIALAGKKLRYIPHLVGDVLLLERGEM